MALSARTPREVFRLWQGHNNHTLNKILTDYRLRLTIRNAKQERTVLSFFNDQGEHVAVPLASSPWYLFINQRLQAVPQGRDYVLKVLAYEYRIQRTPSRDDEAEVRFEYVSSVVDAEFPYSRHHVQFHRAYQDVLSGFSPNRLHIPTGGVTIEQVIRFLIADLGVPPLVSNWNEELRKSEEQLQVWTGQREAQ